MSTKLGFGIVGAGNVTTLPGAHIDCLNAIEEAEIVAVFDIDEERAKRAAEMVKDRTATVCRTYEELLAMGKVDAVIVATPNYTHRDYAAPAFAAGKHVFCEKPMEITLEKCNDILSAAQRSGRVLQIGMVLRYSRFYRTIAEVLRRGEIGSPQFMCVHEFRQVFASQWKFEKDKSGGVLVEKAVHTFDTFNWFANSEPRRVVTFGGQNVVKGDKEIHLQDILGQPIVVKGSEIMDNAWVLIEYENQVRACYGLCFFAPHGIRHPIGIIGDAGTLEGELFQEWLEVRPAAHRDAVRYDFAEGKEMSLHLGGMEQFHAFISSVKQGTPVLASGQAGKMAVAVGVAAELSAERGEAVEVQALPGYSFQV